MSILILGHRRGHKCVSGTRWDAAVRCGKVGNVVKCKHLGSNLAADSLCSGGGGGGLVLHEGGTSPRGWAEGCWSRGPSLDPRVHPGHTQISEGSEEGALLLIRSLKKRSCFISWTPLWMTVRQTTGRAARLLFMKTIM